MNNKYKIDGDITTIFLKRSDGGYLKTKISTTDFESVDSFPNSWTARYSEYTKSFYVMGYHKDGNVTLHRWIMNPPDDLMIDHINHDTLDNTRENLRVVSGTINQLNRKVKGVFFDKKSKLWVARLQVNRKRKVIGCFKTEIEAIEAAATARKEALERELEVLNANIIKRSNRPKRARSNLVDCGS